jgi:hypothetical protein
MITNDKTWNIMVPTFNTNLHPFLFFQTLIKNKFLMNKIRCYTLFPSYHATFYNVYINKFIILDSKVVLYVRIGINYYCDVPKSIF